MPSHSRQSFTNRLSFGLPNLKKPSNYKIKKEKKKKDVKIKKKAKKKKKAMKRKLDTTATYRLYKTAQKKFRKLFKEAKKKCNIKQIEKACQDQTGAEFYRIIKQLEPKLNKRPQ